MSDGINDSHSGRIFDKDKPPKQARAAEQGQQFTDDRVQTPSDELLMRYVENHLSVMGAFPNPPCNCRLHRALLAIGQLAQPPAEQTDEQKVEAILINALKKLSTLGNGEHPGNSIGNEIAQKALTDAIRLREELKAGKHD